MTFSQNTGWGQLTIRGTETNAAAATIRGVEAENTSRVGRGIEAGGHLTGLDATYDRYIAVAVDRTTGGVSGNLGLAGEVLARAVRISHQRVLDHTGRQLADIDLTVLWKPRPLPRHHSP